MTGPNVESSSSSSPEPVDLSEFEIIKRFFSDITFPHPLKKHLSLGVGDDAAILNLPKDQELVFSIDTQIEGIHFPKDVGVKKAEQIARRAFNCALSDLAAMAATPLCFTLALTLPEVNKEWLASFSQGLKNAAKEFSCSLVGGDTTKGPLSITLQVQGTVATGKAIQRSGAQVGDSIFITGFLGNSAAYVRMLEDERLMNENKHSAELFSEYYYSPIPRVMMASALQARATSMIDVSDGLLADLNHLCRASAVAAEINLDALPASPELLNTFDAETVLQLMLSGGDDYELCFTLPEALTKDVMKASDDIECPVTCIGKVTEAFANKNNNSKNKVHCYYESGDIFDIKKLSSMGYKHFS